MNRRAFLNACRGALLGAAIAFPRVSLPFDVEEPDSEDELAYYRVYEMLVEPCGTRTVWADKLVGNDNFDEVATFTLSPECDVKCGPNHIVRITVGTQC